MTGGEIGPALLFVLIKTAEKGHIAIEGAKFSKCDRTVRHIDDTGIKLAHHIEYTNSRLIEIPPARIPRVGEQLNLDGTASRPFEREMKIVPGEERIGGKSCDR